MKQSGYTPTTGTTETCSMAAVKEGVPWALACDSDPKPPIRVVRGQIKPRTHSNAHALTEEHTVKHIHVYQPHFPQQDRQAHSSSAVSRTAAFQTRGDVLRGVLLRRHIVA